MANWEWIDTQDAEWLDTQDVEWLDEQTTLAPTTTLTTAAPTTTATTPGPTTVAPTTLPPTTLAPTTIAPTTIAPTTLPPTTLPPTTLPPTTLAPTTLAPTTIAPTTLPPTTPAPTTLPPTTVVPPTTLAPTTMLTTLAPTTTATTAPPTTPVPTTLPPTTPWPGWDVSADPIEVTVSSYNILSHFPHAPIDHEKDQTWTQSTIEVVISIEGANPDRLFDDGLIEVSIDIPEAYFVTGTVIGTQNFIPFTVEIVGEPVFQAQGFPWVKWSKIGYLDFTIDESNVAGKMPMPWKGTVYGIKKLNNSNIVYGENGVSLMTPSGINYGLTNLRPIGIKGKGAFTGTELAHWFIDIEGVMWKLSSSGLERLDYSEFLSSMDDPSMMYDWRNGLIYISNTYKGYVYSTRDESLGGGSANITGLDSQDGTLYVVGCGYIDPSAFQICTDIFDMGTRKTKDIKNIEIGADLTSDIWATVDFRMSKADAFQTIPWVKVNPDGIAYTPCHGLEFRFRFTMLAYEQFEVDYVKIRGQINDWSTLDDPTPYYSRLRGV